MSDDVDDKPTQLLGEDALARHHSLARHAFSDLEVVRAELRAAMVRRPGLNTLEQLPGTFVTQEQKELHSDVMLPPSTA